MHIIIALVLLCAMAGIATAATVTQNITYQGVLTNNGGTPLTGTYSITFKLYDAVTGGTLLGTSVQSVQVANGQFTTPVTFDSGFFDGRALWIGIAVGGDQEMTPRQEIRPVPYALSLRPGAMITSIDTAPALNLRNNGGGRALSVFTTADSSKGVDVTTSGPGSTGVSAGTSAYGSPGVWAYTEGSASNGVIARTHGPYSYGVDAETHNSSSHGVYTSTSGANSDGVYAYTSGDNSHGVYAYTGGYNSDGVYAHTVGQYSDGISGNAYGYGSAAVAARAWGQYSQGVYAWSNQSNGVEADTANTNHLWGVYTDDYIYAGGIRTPDVDLAEYMPVTENVTPGTVMVIGEEGKLQPSTTSYDTRVAGIISTSPAIALGIKVEGNPGEAIVAISGRVPCKVDATKAPIHAGDLLTTSDMPGFAMKAVPDVINGHKYFPDGTILGKAMGSLESGTGTIEVLVTLQ